jgi:prepilin peptidase CpaA
LQLGREEPAVYELAILTVFPAAVAFAGAMDLFTMTIPHRISVALVAGFAVLAPLAGLGLGDMASHAGAGLLVLAIGVLLFIPGWIGGGDAKLTAAVALWLGFESLFAYLFCVALAGGVLTILFMKVRATPLPPFMCTQPWAVRLHDRRTGIPYGIALAAGALLVYPHTSWFMGSIG